MKKKIASFFLAVCLLTLCMPQYAFAEESNVSAEGINSLYEQAYIEALKGAPDTINSDEDAYAYVLSDRDCISQTNDGFVLFNRQDANLSEQENEKVLDFIKKLNKLIQLEAVTVDENMKLHFVLNPPGVMVSTRRPVASIMAEARNHANELKEVFDNALFTTKHLIAGMYFAERVKSGGIWDYKSYMGTNTVYYMEDLNTNMSGETIGNFHYGYVGRAVFEAATLKSAAGMYQILSGTSDLGYWDSFFDDPADQHDIEKGIQKYESEH